MPSQERPRGFLRSYDDCNFQAYTQKKSVNLTRYVSLSREAQRRLGREGVEPDDQFVWAAAIRLENAKNQRHTKNISAVENTGTSGNLYKASA